MRIVEVETRNHKVLGDIHLKTEAEIISFIGRNGSGKSFLLFILHPNGSSDRYSNAYPILANTVGYKRIVFKDNYGTLYETIHEYTPKPKTDKHSCKSYLNIIENGVKRELNQNGHVLLYEELIEKYLHFNSSVADICYITSKVDGLTSASPKRRKEIIESTNYSTILKTMQDNAQEELRNHKSMLKVLGDRRTEIIGTKSKKEIEDDIANLKDSLNFSNTNLAKFKNQQMELTLDIKEKEKLSISKKDLVDIKNLINILDILNMNGYDDIISKLVKTRNDLNINSERVRSIDKSLMDYDDKLKIIKNKEFIIEELKELNISKDNIERKIMPLFSTTDIDNILDNFKAFKSIIPSLFNVRNNEYIELGPTTFKSYIEDTKDKLKLSETFVNKYEIIKDETDESLVNSSIDIKDNCNTCPLYNKFIKRALYLKDNEDKYNTEKENIQIFNNILYDLESLYTESNISILSNLYNILSDIGRTKCGIQKTFEEIYNINKQYDEITSFIIGSLVKLKDLIDNIKFKNIELNSYENYDKIQIQSEINKLTEEKSKYQIMIKNDLDIVNNLGRYENIDISDDYKHKTKSELIDKVNTFANKVSIIEKLKYRLNDANTYAAYLESKIEEDSRSLVIVEHKLKSLNETVDSILKYTTDTDFYKRAKEILSRDIPILMLQNNLEFMKNTTNKIFEDNNIDIVIDMQSNGTEINIPVYINGELVPDIRHVSQGENCLISLLLNASMCHLIGYNIIYLDEIDANLDIINKEKFNNIVYSILNHLNIDQIFCISHNIASNIESAKKFVLGNPDPSFHIPKDAIKVKK